MPLSAGTRLGTYEVIAAIGAGGMGEVYRARDTRLGRDVALKILPDTFAADPERLVRFEREARTLASLNHPNIAQIYGVEESAGVRAIVMELVDGSTLEEMIAAGVDTAMALAIARQIADALEAAHELGIIHRDLKPANVKVRAEGVVKVLDFGLAKAMSDEGNPSAGGSASVATALSPAMTGIGVILGTAAYMSPEQARGRAVDKRADIWAFGVLVYEMLTGRQAYQGETVSDTIAAVLTREIDLNALPPNVPAAVRPLLARCLERDPKRRLRDIGEARLLLEPSALDASPPPSARRPSSRLALAVWPVLVLVAGVAAWLIGRATANPAEVAGPVMKSHIALQAADIELRGAAVSPDGSMVVYSAGGRLWVQRLDQWAPRELVALETPTMVAWSPQSDAIAFQADGRLMKLAISGGAPVPVVVPTATRAGLSGAMFTWRADDQIFYSTGEGPMYQVSANGGEPRAAFQPPALDGPTDFHTPRTLPGRDELLAILHRSTGLDAIVMLGPAGVKMILDTPGRAMNSVVYSPSGHLVFTRSAEEMIWAVRFSLSTLTVEGEPFMVEPGRLPSVSTDGTLFYIRAPAVTKRRLTWVSRNGETVATSMAAQEWREGLAISADGRRLLAADGGGIWVYDLVTGSRSRLTKGDADSRPVWLPGGRVALTRGESDGVSVVIASGSGTGAEQTIAKSARYPSVPADGRVLVFNHATSSNGSRVWVPAWIDLQKPGEVHRLEAHAGGRFPEISPDGSLLLYVSRETGRDEIWVTRFPSGEGKWQVSTTGGGFATWSRKGDEILFRTGDGRLSSELMSVAVRRGPEPAFAAATKVFSWGVGWDLWYALSPDGQRVLVPAADGDLERPTVRVVRNWFREFEGK